MRSLLLGSMLACVANVHAATWSFDYIGATSNDAPFSLLHVPGKFTGDDLNGDGSITRDEVRTFELLGYQMSPGTDMFVPGLPPGSVTSSLTTFSFDVASQTLSFTGIAGTWHNAFEKTATELRYTTPMGLFAFNLSPALLEIERSDGAFSVSAPISPSPVPEPSTGLMLALGLAATWTHRRHIRK